MLPPDEITEQVNTVQRKVQSIRLFVVKRHGKILGLLRDSGKYVKISREVSRFGEVSALW